MLKHILLLLLILSSIPGLVHAQTNPDSRFTANFNQKSLSEILNGISFQTGKDFYYKSEWLPDSSYSFSFQNAPLDSALEVIFENIPLGFMAFDTYAYVIAPQTWLVGDFGDLVSLSQFSKINQDSDQMLVVGDSTLPLNNNRATITGTVFNTNNKETIEAARITVTALKTGAISDKDGRYRIELPPGNHQVQIIATGFDTLNQEIQVKGNGDWDIEMELLAFSLDAVVVEASASDQNVSSVQIGVSELKMDEIVKLPAFLGEVDVVRTLLTLPGVSNVGEGAGGFNVRGGNIDQNLIMQDGAPLLNSSHVLGFFSLFHSDIVNKITLFKGNIPAQYGGRLSSLLNVELKEGNFKKFKMKGGLGIISSRLMMEGPIVKDKTSLLIGARASYSDWVLRLVRDNDLRKSSVSFSDLNAKLTHRINQNHILSLSAYNSRDFFRYSDQFGYAWGTQLANFRWVHILSNQFSGTLSASAGRYQSSFFDPEGVDAFELKNGMQYTKVKQNFIYTPGSRHQINMGGEWLFYQGIPESTGPYQGLGDVVQQEVSKGRAHELSIYINDEIDISPIFAISVGLRYTQWLNTGPEEVFSYAPDLPRETRNITGSTTYQPGELIKTYGGLEPRLSVRMNLDETSSIKLSYNRLRQYIHLISNTSASTPVDIWQVSNTHIPPQTADNFSIGYFKNFQQNRWETSIELYYKNIIDVVDFKDLPVLLLNRYLETELLTGKGRAYGMELSVKKNYGQVSGWMSYTFARTLRRVTGEFPQETINQGAWFPAPFDKPHTLNMVMTYQPNKRNTISANFTYSTGRPITIPLGDYTLGNTIIPHYSLRNQFRIPDYHRLDFSYTLDTYAIRKQRYQDSWTFSIYNLYFRKNAFSVFFKTDDRQRPQAFRLAVLGTAFPALTYNFRF
jgi:hypothetical protein